MPALESTNTFSGGMSSDNSKFFQRPDTYLEALNFRVVTTNGQSNHALVNIKGNEYKTTLANTFPIYKVEPTIPSTSTSVVPCTITINGVVSNILNVNAGTTGYDIFVILEQMSNYGIDFYVAYYQDSVVIWSETINPNPVLSSTALAFVTQYGMLHNWYVAPQSNLVPIGSTYIRDDIYVFTTPSTSNPNTAPNTGQIWKLEYDTVSLTAALKLIYNNYINFSTSYPIPPTATHGRFESSTIQRLYWTDNYNPLRSCNAKDSNLMAFPSGLLNIFPLAEPFIPTLKSIDMAGSLKTGIYQFAYRLKKSNSQVTLWSPLSQIIPIQNNSTENAFTGGGPATQWQAFIGLAANAYTTVKSITASIEKLDENFDYIDVVVCKRYSNNDPGTFEIFLENQPIVPNQPIVFTYRGTETITTLTLNEFLLTSPGFTHCKTIETKDNRLFAGNVRVEQSNLDFDARAYQFDSTGTAHLVNNGISTGYSYLGQLSIPFYLPETYDTINEDYLKWDSTSAQPPTNAHRFQSDGVTVGGEGPNIKFKFGAFAVKVDDVPNTDFSATPDNTPWRHTNQNYNSFMSNINLGIDKENYNQHDVNDGYKSAYKSFLLRSYQPNEIYRFGLQAYDKQGSPYFVKWIADIRMPDYHDACFNQPLGDGDDQLTSNFGLTCPSNTNPNQKYYMKPIYINFTVDVSSIKDKISGFEIVRCERTAIDRVVAGTGYITQVEYTAGTDLTMPNSEAGGTATPNNSNLFMDTTVAAAPGNYRKSSYTLDCFDWLYEGHPGVDSYDRICIKGVMEKSIASDFGYTLTGGGVYNNAYRYAKNYVWSGYPTITQDELGIVELARVAENATYALTDGSGYIFQNSNAASIADKRYSGSVTHFTTTTSDYNYAQYLGGLGDPYKVYFEYRKYTRLLTQYGGRNYNARTQSEYISCGMYVPINDISIVNTSSISFDVFGGDSYYNVFDLQKGNKYWPNRAGGNDIESYIQYMPVINYHNSDLRNGRHFESDLGNQVTSSGWTPWNTSSYAEDFSYDNTYSIENNVRKFFPKPLLINDTNSWDNRVYYSEVKINGEVQDSWENFKVNNFWDVEGSYGPINSLIAYADKLYFIQKKAFGWLLVNLQSLTTTTNGATLSLGKGDVIARHDYVSTDVGTSHQWSVTRSPSSILFVDATTKKVYKYNPNGLVPISDVYEQKGVFVRLLHDDILINDNPILDSGILCVYDFFNDEYLITLLNKYTRSSGLGVTTHQEYNTISFNEKIDRWNSFYSFTPNLYLFNRTQLWSNNPLINNELYIHNIGDYCKFYGIVYPSTVKLLVNQNSRFTKMFNNFMFNTQAIDETSQSSQYGDINIVDSTFDSFRAYNDYQNTDFITLNPSSTPPTIRRVERQWNLQCPRNKVLYTTASPDIFTDLGNKLYGERMRDKYLTIDLSYDNTNDYKLIFNNFNTKYLISDR